MAVETLIQFRRGAAATWDNANPTLSAGEPGYESDSGRFKIGDGSTAWNSLEYIGENLEGDVSISGNLTVTGDMTVNGTTTTINSTEISVDDINIVLGDTASPTDASADGGGLTLKGATDKTFNWVDSSDSWTSSEHMNLASGKSYYINGSNVLSGSTLGAGVTSSSLTSVGTISSGTWEGTAIENAYLDNVSVSFGGVSVDLGGSDATPAFDLSDALGYVGDANLVTVGTVTSGTWEGTAIENAYLDNVSVSFGGVSLDLGGSDATPAFDLSDALGYVGDANLVTVGTVASGTWEATVIGVAYGGTGLASYTAGDLIYASNSTTLAKLAKGTGNQFLKMNDAGNALEWNNGIDGGTP